MKAKIDTISMAVIALCLIIQAVLMFTDDNEGPATPVTTAISPENAVPDPSPSQAIYSDNIASQLSDQQAITGGQQPQLSIGDNAVIPTNPSSITTITFEQPLKDLGTIKAGEIVQHTFNFVNAGNLPLTMAGVNVDAGCTLISAPTDPIPSGGSGKIVVEFNSEGMSGPVTKTIHVNANTDPGHQHINFTANIIE